MRRNAVRLSSQALGSKLRSQYDKGESIGDLHVPAVLRLESAGNDSILEEQIVRYLSPLVVEWLIGVASGLEPESSPQIRAIVLQKMLQSVVEEAKSLVGACGTSASWLEDVLTPPAMPRLDHEKDTFH